MTDRGDWNWQNDAACTTSDVNFFPGRGESLDDARAICDGCPVKAECLEYALRHHVEHGIWGGLSERERQRLRRYRQVGNVAHAHCKGCRNWFEYVRTKSSRRYCSVECKNVAVKAQNRESMAKRRSC